MVQPTAARPMTIVSAEADFLTFVPYLGERLSRIVPDPCGVPSARLQPRRLMISPAASPVLGIGHRLLQPKQLMLQGHKIDNHAPHPSRRCHVEMVAVSAEASMAVTMNVRPDRIRV